MAIEFHCDHCGKFLSTDESKAGRQAKCPGCGEMVTVPQPTGGESGDEPRHESPSVPPVGGTRPCPMCGADVPAGAKSCPACGEELNVGSGPQAGAPARFEVGEAISTGWEITKRNLGFLVALVVVAILLNLVVQLPGIAASVMAQMEVQQGQPPNMGLIMFSNLWNLPAVAFSLFIGCGQTLACLRVARGEVASIGDLFAGGRFFLRSLLLYLVFAILLFVGCLACIIPGIYVLIRLWPYMFVLVAEDRPGLDSLTRTWELTNLNQTTSLVLIIALAGIYLLGALACGIGVLISLPVCLMAATVAYLRMSGQMTVIEAEAA